MQLAVEAYLPEKWRIIGFITHLGSWQRRHEYLSCKHDAVIVNFR